MLSSMFTSSSTMIALKFGVGWIHTNILVNFDLNFGYSPFFLLAWVYKISFQLPFHLMNHGVALATTCLQVYWNLEAHCELWLHKQSFQGSWITCPTQCAPIRGLGPPFQCSQVAWQPFSHFFVKLWIGPTLLAFKDYWLLLR